MKQNKTANTITILGGLLTIIGLTLFNDQKTLQLIILAAGVVVTAIGVLMLKKSTKEKS